MFRSNLVIGLTIFVTIVLVALFAPWIAHYDPVSHSNLLYAEEAPGAHHAAMPVRQRAADLESFTDGCALRFEPFHGHSPMMQRLARADNRR